MHREHVTTWRPKCLSFPGATVPAKWDKIKVTMDVPLSFFSFVGFDSVVLRRSTETIYPPRSADTPDPTPMDFPHRMDWS